MGELSNLPNIGKTVEAQLEQVGIYTYSQLKERGTEQTWLDIQKIDDSACIHRLLAFEGAILGIRKTDISEDRKQELKK